MQSTICRGCVWVYMLVQSSHVYEFYLECTVLAATIGCLATASHVPDGHVLMAIISECKANDANSSSYHAMESYIRTKAEGTLLPYSQNRRTEDKS
ncbi:hypothetical protein VNO77_02491 [Canavalia gladiata]|uniref:Uncharacterized protein n=1 Tax=Canavalia gladiata TaxID=3824 RepID=A0AAN9MTC2_CANGL